MGPGGRVFVTDGSPNCRVQYFTPTGRYRGEWGEAGKGSGQFQNPYGIAFSTATGWIYVTDDMTFRVQYFRWSAPAVVPTSLGRVKALFR